MWKAADPLLALALLVACSPLCSAYCLAFIARPLRSGLLKRRSAALLSLPLLAAHAALPTLFDPTTAAVVAAQLAAAFYTWWGTMKVVALLFSDGPLAHFAGCSRLHFWCAYFLPVSLAPPADGLARPDHAGTIAATALFRLCLLLATLATLDAGLPHLSAGTLLGDAGWCLVLLLAVTGLMDVAGLLATLSGLSVLPAFYSPLLATSTSNFWGRRWNLTAVRLLRAGVYRPARLLGAPRPLAVGLSFAVSGVAHELIVWYSSSSGAAYAAVRGQWLAFFLVQAPIVVAEPALSSLTSHVTSLLLPKALRGTRLGAVRALCARIGALGAVFLTARLLFLPPAFTLGWPKLFSDAILANPRRLLGALASVSNPAQ